jgi:hypothetical protein
MKLPDLSGINVIELCHPRLLNIPLSVGQSMALRAFDGLEMNQQELDLYCEVSGHDSYRPGAFCQTAESARR